MKSDHHRDSVNRQHRQDENHQRKALTVYRDIRSQKQRYASFQDQ